MTPPDSAIVYGGPPSLLVIGDSDTACAHGVAAAATVGLAVLANLGIDEALHRLADAPAPRCVLVEIDGPVDEAKSNALERLLVHLHADATAGRYGSVISTPRDLIDLVAARTDHPDIQQIAAASQLDRAVALGIVARNRGGVVRETPGAGAQAAQLRALAEEVGRLSGTLARLSSAAVVAADNSHVSRPDSTANLPPSDTVGPAEIRGMIRARRMRAQYFDADLFADPAWDMLLDLAAAAAGGKPERVAVSSLCIAAAVPATTALRWIRTLTDAGLFVRVADPADGRRVFIELSAAAAVGMRAYLSALRRLANAPGMGLAQLTV